jgi:glycosyltransferase involved in cell wall biosynthesis
MRLLVIFQRLGPYHYARVGAANKVGPVAALELSGKDRTYAWTDVQGEPEFKRDTVFSGAECETHPGKIIYEQVKMKLEAIQPDVVAIPGLYDKGALSSLLWCRRNDVPCILMSDTSERDFRRHAWREWIKRQVTAHYSAALVGGQAQKRYLCKLGMPEHRIFTGYDVVDNDYFSAKAGEARDNALHHRRQYSLPERYFLSSTRFIPRKNLLGLICAYAEYRKRTLSPWDMVILGDGELMPQVKCHLSALDVQDHVILPGFIQYEGLPHYYGLASCYVQASIAEPWGLAVNEAMASGLPVLASDACGCVPDLLRDGVNGFTFDPRDTADIAEKMRRISQADGSLDAMGQMSRQIISNWPSSAFGNNLWQAAELACRDPIRIDSRVGSLILAALVFAR